jgi:hypothetical protein
MLSFVFDWDLIFIIVLVILYNVFVYCVLFVFFVLQGPLFLSFFVGFDLLFDAD